MIINKMKIDLSCIDSRESFDALISIQDKVVDMDSSSEKFNDESFSYMSSIGIEDKHNFYFVSDKIFVHKIKKLYMSNNWGINIDYFYEI